MAAVVARAVLPRLLVAGGLLLGEYLAISLVFDAQVVAHRGGVWSVLGQLGEVAPLFVVAATAALLVPSSFRGKDAPELKRPSAVLLALHVAFAAAFVLVTRWAFGGEAAPPGPALLWMLGWTSLGVATGGTLVVGLIGEWRWLSRMLVRAFLAGGALGLLGWLAGTLSTRLWEPLSRATFQTVAALLRLLSVELYVDEPNVVLGLDDFAVEIAPVCSGFEGIGLFTVLMLGFLYQFRADLRFPRALLLLPLGMAAVWFGNAVRIAALMLLGARVDPELALGSFHSKAGWVFFCAITLALAVLARKWSFFSRSAQEAAAFENPTTPLLLPLMVWIGVGLSTSMFSEGHDPLYGARVVAALAVLWVFRASYRAWWQPPTLAAWLVGAAIGVAWLLGPLQFAPPEGANAPPNEAWSPLQYGGWLIARVVGAVVIVPVVEELAFRGYVARWLTRRDFTEVALTQLSWLGIAGSSVAFGLVHDQWLLGMLTGVAYGLLVRRSGRMSDAVVAHAMSNLVIAGWVLTTDNWQHW